jgi:hypothetical protein
LRFRSLPQSFGQHPPAQRFRVDAQPVILLKMLGRQRRTEPLPRPLVALRYDLQRSLPQFVRLGSIGALSRVAMHQPGSSAALIARKQPLGLPVTQLQHRSRIYLLQLTGFHPLHHPGSPRLLLDHPCPSHRTSSVQFQGTLLSSYQGDIIIEVQQHFHEVHA